MKAFEAIRTLRSIAFLLTSLVAAHWLMGCASTEKTKQENAAVTAAQNMERRAAQAYMQGSSLASANLYASAVLVYESLALSEPLARARLSEARARAEDGQMDRALELVNRVLAQVAANTAPMSSDTQVLAHGRAAALYLALHDGSPPSVANTSDHLQKASAALQNAQIICRSTCLAQTALLVLRARIDLAQGNASAALQSATTALATNLTEKDAEQANALRIRAQTHARLGQHANAVADASAALAIDQQAGSASRVLQDLEILALTHQAMGDTAQAMVFRQLVQSARLAVQALQRGAPQPAN